MFLTEQNYHESNESTAVKTLQIDFYTQKGCHLCEEAFELLEKLQQEFDFRIHLIDISESPHLLRCYGNDIPVATLDGRTIIKHRPDERLLRRVLATA